MSRKDNRPQGTYFRYSLLLSKSYNLIAQSDSLDELMGMWEDGYVIMKNKAALRGLSLIIEWHRWAGLYVEHGEELLIRLGFLTLGLSRRYTSGPDKVIYPPSEV